MRLYLILKFSKFLLGDETSMICENRCIGFLKTVYLSGASADGNFAM